MNPLLVLGLLLGGEATVTLRIPILMYHHIADVAPGQEGTTAADISCPRDLLRAHLKFLKQSGYATLGFEDVRAVLEGRQGAPEKAVILTFDDGDASHWDAFEDLRQNGMKGVFFVVTKTLGDRSHLTREQLKEMAGAGMEIGSHSVSHWDLKDLRLEEKEREILASQKELEELLGRPVISFCYPGGNFDKPSYEILAKSHYWFARTTLPGVTEIKGREFLLKTIPIFRGTTPRRLEAKLRAYRR